MAVSIGIVGLPNAGKSTLFNALTSAGALAANYPFATIDPNVGVVDLPDPRLAVLAQLSSSVKIVPAPVTFVDIAGIVRGASTGEGLGNKFLANIREVDAICQVTRIFTDPDVSHVEGGVDPERDISTIATELILADLQTLDRALPRLEKEVRLHKERAPVLAAAQQAQQVLNAGRTIHDAGLDDAGLDVAGLREFFLLTSKPFLHVFNGDEATLADPARRAELEQLVRPAPAVFLDAAIEAELAELDGADAAEMLTGLGMTERSLDVLARAGFGLLGLQTYLTTGPKETRAWTIRRGATAPEAAGVIHTDFQRGFIKAEVVSYDDLVAAGSLLEARSHGRARIEGKDYVMADGDVVEFRFNV